MSLDWSCQKHGCFKDNLPDWGWLDSAFPGKCRVGDIDGMVEMYGRHLFLEWKPEGKPLHKGQEIALRRLTQNSRSVALVLFGDARLSVVRSLQLIQNGEVGPIVAATNEDVFDFCHDWGTPNEVVQAR